MWVESPIFVDHGLLCFLQHMADMNLDDPTQRLDLKLHFHGINYEERKIDVLHFLKGILIRNLIKTLRHTEQLLDRMNLSFQHSDELVSGEEELQHKNPTVIITLKTSVPLRALPNFLSIWQTVQVDLKERFKFHCTLRQTEILLNVADISILYHDCGAPENVGIEIEWDVNSPIQVPRSFLDLITQDIFDDFQTDPAVCKWVQLWRSCCPDNLKEFQVHSFFGFTIPGKPRINYRATNIPNCDETIKRVQLCREELKRNAGFRDQLSWHNLQDCIDVLNRIDISLINGSVIAVLHSLSPFLVVLICTMLYFENENMKNRIQVSDMEDRSVKKNEKESIIFIPEIKIQKQKSALFLGLGANIILQIYKFVPSKFLFLHSAVCRQMDKILKFSRFTIIVRRSDIKIYKAQSKIISASGLSGKQSDCQGEIPMETDCHHHKRSDFNIVSFMDRGRHFKFLSCNTMKGIIEGKKKFSHACPVELDLTSCMIDSSFIELLLSWFMNGNSGCCPCNSLRKIQLLDNCLGPQGIGFISVQLKCFHQLARLGLGSNNIGKNGLRYLCSGLMQCFTLVELDLSNNNLSGNRDDECPRLLAELLTKLIRLSYLHLQWNQIGDKGSKIVIDSLDYRQPGGMHLLDLRENGLSGRFVITLVSNWSNGWSKPRRVAAELPQTKQDGWMGHGRQAGACGARAGVVEAVRKPLSDSRIQHLNGLPLQSICSEKQEYYDLSCAMLGAAEAGILSLLLQYYRIFVLFLRGNRIDTTGAKMLAFGIKMSTSIRIVDLSQNMIGTCGLQALDKVCRKSGNHAHFRSKQILFDQNLRFIPSNFHNTAASKVNYGLYSSESMNIHIKFSFASETGHSIGVPAPQQCTA